MAGSEDAETQLRKLSDRRAQLGGQQAEVLFVAEALGLCQFSNPLTFTPAEGSGGHVHLFPNSNGFRDRFTVQPHAFHVKFDGFFH